MVKYLLEFANRQNYCNLEGSSEITNYSAYNNVHATIEPVLFIESVLEYVFMREALKHANNKMLFSLKVCFIILTISFVSKYAHCKQR